MRAFPVLIFAAFVVLVRATESIPPTRTAIFAREEAADFIRSHCRQAPAGITGYWTPEPGDVMSVEAGLLRYLQAARPELARWLASDGGKRVAGDWAWLRRRVVGVAITGERHLLLEYQVEDPAEMRQQEQEAKAKLRDRFRADWWKHGVRRHGGFSVFRVLYHPKSQRFTWYEEND